jgi:CrcB protein
MGSYLLVFLGGGIGAALRHGVNRASLALLGPAFPYGTLLVNVAGSALMGALAAWFAGRAGAGDSARLFLGTGVLGGFTTFSAFSLDAVALWERGQAGASLAYVAASVLLSVAALLAGMAAMRALG